MLGGIVPPHQRACKEKLEGTLVVAPAVAGVSRSRKLCQSTQIFRAPHLPQSADVRTTNPYKFRSRPTPQHPHPRQPAQLPPPPLPSAAACLSAARNPAM